MLRFSLGVTRDIHRGRAQVGCFGDQAREARLRWFGHVQRRDSDYVGKRMLRFMLPERQHELFLLEEDQRGGSWI